MHGHELRRSGRIMDAMEKLPEDQRQVILLREDMAWVS